VQDDLKHAGIVTNETRNGMKDGIYEMIYELMDSCSKNGADPKRRLQ
jgi:hypothetical protein